MEAHNHLRCEFVSVDAPQFGPDIIPDQTLIALCRGRLEVTNVAFKPGVGNITHAELLKGSGLDRILTTRDDAQKSKGLGSGSLNGQHAISANRDNCLPAAYAGFEDK